MAYQPLYVTLTDATGRTRTTSSMRGRVDSATVDIKTLFGDAGQIHIYVFEGRHHVEKPNLSRVPKADRARVRAEYEEACRKADEVRIYVQLKKDPRFKVEVT